MRGTLSSALSGDQVRDYQRDGFLVVPDLITPDEAERFIAHAAQPGPQERMGLQGHRVDEQWKFLAHHPRAVSIVEQLLSGPARIVQTMYLNKPPAAQGIALHQDTHYLPTEPNTLMACWIALSDTGPANGGLCVVPGSHLGGLRQTHQARDNQQHLSWVTEYAMRDRDGREWKQKMYSFEIEDLDPASVVRLSVPVGAGVFFTGMTIHGSFANPSPDKPRRAFATHYVREGTWVLRADVQETVAVEHEDHR